MNDKIENLEDFIKKIKPIKSNDNIKKVEINEKELIEKLINSIIDKEKNNKD